MAIVSVDGAFGLPKAALKGVEDPNVFAVVFRPTDVDAPHLLQRVQLVYRNALVCLVDPDAPLDLPKLRDYYVADFHLVCGSISAVRRAAGVAASVLAQEGEQVTCPVCSRQFPAGGAYIHYPLFHGVKETTRPGSCFVCRRKLLESLGRHLNSEHSPPDHRDAPRPQWPSFSFVAALRLSPDPRYAVILDKGGVSDSGIGQYWLPAGRVDEGESMVEAAVRETKEEAGIDVTPVALIRLTRDRHGVMRCTLLGKVSETAGDPEAPLYAKSFVDYESCGAFFATPKQIAELPRDLQRGGGLDECVRHATGKSRGLPLDHPAVADLDAYIRRCSSGEFGPMGWGKALGHEEGGRIIDALEKACPGICEYDFNYAGRVESK